MITNGYKRMLRNDSDIKNELWNETYKELRAECKKSNSLILN